MRVAVCLACSLALCFTLSAGCSSPPPEPAAGCNPVLGDDCMSPFPSSFFETADPTCATGMRVALSSSTLPVSNSGGSIKTDRMNARDGFSPSTQFLVYFKAGVNAAELPGLDNLAASIAPTSTVQILDFDSGERLPVFAELDANAGPGDRQALIIHPAMRLTPGHRYVIALVALHDAAGKLLEPAPFRALRDRAPLNHALTMLKARYEDLFGVLTKAGLDRSRLSLAWDVVVASDDSATRHLLTMRDKALALAQAGQLGYAITSSTDETDPHLLREVVGTVDVPMYLADDSGASGLTLDATGLPVMRTIGKANLVIHIPQCAATATAPLPVLVFGHGLFGKAQTELNTDYEKQVGDELCMVQIGTDWLGLDADDVATVAEKVLPDLNQLTLVTDRLQQAQVNAQTMTRLFLTKIKDDPALQINGKAVTDGSQVYYYGISDGGIQGGTFLALSPDVQRGVLNVPGCEWTLMMFRSHDFNSLQVLIGTVLPDTLDQQVVLTLSQSEWDYSDPATFVPHLLASPLPGAHADKRIILQESEGDAQVPNVSTRIEARLIGLPGLDLEHPVYGIDEKPAPLDSAYTQWDVHSMPLPPAGNKPAPVDNQAHEGIRRLPALIAQLKAFFTPTGQVTQTCSGPCSFPVPDGTPPP